MPTKRIQLIAPTFDIARRAEAVAREMGIEDQLGCHVANLREGLKLAHKLEEQGAEVFIARRGTANMIQSSLPTPLVHVPVKLEDITQALARARNLTGLERPKVAFFGMPFLDDELNMFAQLLDFELRLYHVVEQEDLLASTLVTAIAEGANVIVAGSVVTQMAQERGVHAVMLDSGHLSLREALNEAKSIAYARTLEKSQNERFRAVVDNSNDGVVVLDEVQRVQMANPAALRILGKGGIPAGTHVSVLFPGIDLTECYSGTPIRNAVVDSARGTLLLSMVPTHVGGEVGGAVLSFMPAESIAELGAAIHKTKHARGFSSQYDFGDIKGRSPRMEEAREKALAYATGKAPVLLVGETGTGKELFAHAIHNASPYGRGPFVTVNCASLPSSLLESELFGYEEGAFTGAARNGKPGFFELAHHGSIFLDEVSELDLYAQIRLLRVLQERTTMRIGGSRVIPLDIRIIAATNRNLWDMVRKGEFRKDLFFRLNVLPIFIPPLRERTDDVELIARHALSLLTPGKEDELLNRETLGALSSHTWPGNVRELLNVVERYTMDCEHLGKSPGHITRILNPELQWAGMGEVHDAGIPAVPGERERILEALEKNGWHQIKTAKQLGMDRTTLYRKMRIHGLRKFS